MINNEIVKFIFNDSKKINNSDYSWRFLKQIINANVKDFKLGLDSFRDLYIWKNGTWKDGTWKNGIWYDGTWKNGIWLDGDWYDGKWEYGLWEDGRIYNPKTKKFEPSKIPPNECEWSLSYDRS